jgi:hypothetical protein
MDKWWIKRLCITVYKISFQINQWKALVCWKYVFCWGSLDGICISCEVPSIADTTLIEVKSLIWAQKGKLYIIYENVMWIQWPTIPVWWQKKMYCSDMPNVVSAIDGTSHEIQIPRQQIASQWGLQLIFRMHNSNPTPQGVKSAPAFT